MFFWSFHFQVTFRDEIIINFHFSIGNLLVLLSNPHPALSTYEVVLVLALPAILYWVSFLLSRRDLVLTVPHPTFVSYVVVLVLASPTVLY